MYALGGVMRGLGSALDSIGAVVQGPYAKPDQREWESLLWSYLFKFSSACTTAAADLEHWQSLHSAAAALSGSGMAHAHYAIEHRAQQITAKAPTLSSCNWFHHLYSQQHTDLPPATAAQPMSWVAVPTKQQR
jgi:hypothetical protein